MKKSDCALLIVDVQNDFCPGGALGIKEGDKIIPAINKYIEIFIKNNLPIILTRDWHPAETRHFKRFGGAWPGHCIQNTKGAEFHPQLRIPEGAIIISKGMNPAKDSYSAFQAFDSAEKNLPSLLKEKGISELFICGLATDYCVKFTALDALKSAFKVNVLADAIKGVDLQPKDSENALKEIISLGAKAITLKDVPVRS